MVYDQILVRVSRRCLVVILGMLTGRVLTREVVHRLTYSGSKFLIDKRRWHKQEIMGYNCKHDKEQKDVSLSKR